MARSMATRSLFTAAEQTSMAVTRSYSSLVWSRSLLRPLVAGARLHYPAVSSDLVGGFATRQISSSINVPPPAPSPGLNNRVMEEEPNSEIEEPTIYFRLGASSTPQTDPITKVCNWFAIPPTGVNGDTNAYLSPAFHEPPLAWYAMTYTPVVAGAHIYIITHDVTADCDVPIRRVRYLNTQSEEKKWEDGPSLEKAPKVCYTFDADGKIYALGVYGDNLFSLHCLDHHKLEEGWKCLVAKECDEHDHSLVSSSVIAHTIEYEAVTDSTTSQPMRCARRAIIVTLEGIIFYDFKKNEIYMYPTDICEGNSLSTCGVCHDGLMYLLSSRYDPYWPQYNHTRVVCLDVEKGKWCGHVKGFEKYENALPKLCDPEIYICQTPSLFLHLGRDRFCFLWRGHGSELHCTKFSVNVTGGRRFAEKVSTQVYMADGFANPANGDFMAVAI